MRRAMISSFSLRIGPRIGSRAGDRYRFFASCCVIVLAPRTAVPCSQLAWIASRSCT
jgi:hypothetical protein